MNRQRRVGGIRAVLAVLLVTPALRARGRNPPQGGCAIGATNDVRAPPAPYPRFMPTALAASLALLSVTGTVAPLFWFARISRRPA